MRLRWTFWDILGQFGILFDELGEFRQFSHVFPTIFISNLPIEKKTRTDGPSYRDAWTHLKMRVLQMK